MNPLVQRELGLLIVSVSMNLDGTGTLTFDHKHRGIIKIIPFPKLPDAFNTLERIVRYSHDRAQAHIHTEGYEVNFFRLSPSLVMVKAPLSYLTTAYGNGEKLNAAYAAALLDSNFFPLPEELDVAYYKEDNGFLVMVIEDKSR